MAVGGVCGGGPEHLGAPGLFPASEFPDRTNFGALQAMRKARRFRK